MNLHIIKAEYGANDTFIDITGKLKQNFVKNNSIEILKGTNLNHAFTDPCFLNEKIIKIYIGVNSNTLILYDYEYDNKLLNNILIDDEYLKKYDKEFLFISLLKLLSVKKLFNSEAKMMLD